MVFLGSPHLGAPLEKGGNWIDFLLTQTPYTEPISRISRHRSAGIRDLRHGYIDQKKTRPQGNQQSPEGVNCLAIAGTMGQSNMVNRHLIGAGGDNFDGAVTVNVSNSSD